MFAVAPAPPDGDEIELTENLRRRDEPRCSLRHVYLWLLTALSVGSFYSDVYITVVFCQSENVAWGILSALLTTAGWLASALQSWRHTSINRITTLALAACGLGPVAVTCGTLRKVNLKQTHERLAKLKLVVAVVEAAPQCFLKSYVFTLTHANSASFSSAYGGVQAASLLLSCISVGWTISYMFIRVLQADCQGEFCLPVPRRVPSTLTRTTDSTDTTCQGMLDHVCLPVWLSMCVRVLASSDVATHVARLTVFAVAYRGLVCVPLVVMFALGAGSAYRKFHFPANYDTVHGGRGVGDGVCGGRLWWRRVGVPVMSSGFTGLFVNLYMTYDGKSGVFVDAFLWWLMDEVMLTLVLVGCVLYSPSLGLARVRGVCATPNPNAPTPPNTTNCVPMYYLQALGATWAITQVLYLLVLIGVAWRRRAAAAATPAGPASRSGTTTPMVGRESTVPLVEPPQPPPPPPPIALPAQHPPVAPAVTVITPPWVEVSHITMSPSTRRSVLSLSHPGSPYTQVVQQGPWKVFTTSPNALRVNMASYPGARGPEAVFSITPVAGAKQ